MSFGTLLDALRTQIPTLTGFTAKQELFNPYAPEENGEPYLRDSWGVVIGPAVAGATEYGTLSQNQEFGIVLARAVVSIDGDPTPLVTAEKALAADILTLRRDFMAADNMGLDSTIEMIDYLSTDPIRFGSSAEDYKWLVTTVNFTAALRESP